ncbi:MAG TPA: helix-hairpin-helix domain-containing protein, partial [Bacillota bacterium]|nr:helix-hairpin-helix domain-containing protein [Bacillota bacterium]
MNNKLFFIVPVFVFALVIVLFLKKTDEDANAQFSLINDDSHQTNQLENTYDEENDMVVIDVKGEVEKPGTYEVGMDQRVDDVLEIAGGLTSEADVFSVNRAEKIYDEMVIIVHRKGESSPNGENFPGSNQVRINHATQEEIESLNGIGPSKAQAIIQYREENGPFQKEEDLLDVPGIGEKTLENFKD